VLKVAIMQPYFFPYLGYFQLMSIVDAWVAFDSIQFINKGWINRNRILHPHPQKDWQYITVPLNNRRRFDKINEISIKPITVWKKEIMGKLSCYKKRAPYFKQTIELVEECFEYHDLNLSAFVVNALKLTAAYLGINTPIMTQSSMNWGLEPITHPGQWALRISEELGASEYINPIGGAEIFKREEFSTAGIKLTFLQSDLRPYSQRQDFFVSGLSILDVMMFNSTTQINELLSNFQLVE
jgi:hypothetical protein